MILLSAVFIVKYSKPSRTYEEASRIVTNTLMDIIRGFSEKEIKFPIYPVFIGFNGYDIMPQNVENAFKELSNYFEMIYFDCYNNNNPNRIVYRFKNANPKSDLEYIDLIELLQKIIETILVHHFREQDFYMPCDNLVAVRIQGDVLYVSIAKNDMGIIETKNYRRKHKNDYYVEKFSCGNNEIQIDWNDYEEGKQ